MLKNNLEASNTISFGTAIQFRYFFIILTLFSATWLISNIAAVKLFSLDIFAQGLSAILFFIAAFCLWKRVYVWQTINIAFSLSMSLWAVFLIMEELFIAYPYEATHIRLFMFEMISLLALHLLPHSTSESTLE